MSINRATSRRTVVRTGAKLAYAAPLVAASLGTRSIGAGAVSGGGPTCPLTLSDPGPPALIEVTFRDTTSGLAELLVTKSENADTVIPPFTVGTTDAVVMSSTKIDQTKQANIEIRATDLHGNVSVCEFAF